MEGPSSTASLYAPYANNGEYQLKSKYSRVDAPPPPADGVRPPVPQEYRDMASGATQAMNAGGGIGQIATSAGLYSMNPALIGGGLAITMVEGKQKEKAQHEADLIAAEEKRKANVQSALNTMLTASQGLGIA